MSNHSRVSKSENLAAAEKTSRERFSVVLGVWLTRFAEHYLQPVTKTSADCYREILGHLSPGQIDRACRRAMETQDFIPKAATILRIHEEFEDAWSTPSTFAKYDETPMSESDREAIKAELAGVAKKLSIVPGAKPSRPVEEQKRELRKKGLLG
jgi:hypothetical protein